MAKFNAATAVEAVEYDFKPYVDAEGIIPEPSKEQVETFFDRIKNMHRLVARVERDITNAAEVSNEELEKVVAELPEGEINKMKSELSIYIADLTSNQPTVEQIDGLPYRVFTAFMVHLMTEYGPKGASNDSTTASRR